MFGVPKEKLIHACITLGWSAVMVSSMVFPKKNIKQLQLIQNAAAIAIVCVCSSLQF